MHTHTHTHTHSTRQDTHLLILLPPPPRRACAQLSHEKLLDDVRSSSLLHLDVCIVGRIGQRESPLALVCVCVYLCVCMSECVCMLCIYICVCVCVCRAISPARSCPSCLCCCEEGGGQRSLCRERPPPWSSGVCVCVTGHVLG